MTPELGDAMTAVMTTAGLGYACGLAFVVLVLIIGPRKGGD